MARPNWDPAFSDRSFQSFLYQTSPCVAAIRMEMVRGKRAPEAMDYILGEGAYAAFAGQVYDACRAQVQA